MDILIIGSGGREHAIAWKIAQSPLAGRLYCAPGNAGIAEIAQCVPIGVMEFEKLAQFAKEKQIGLTIVGMDDPLAGGIVDVFQSEGLRIFGPDKKAAEIESSKSFAKNLMQKYGIPTAAYEVFSDAQLALGYLQNAKYPIVIKADGLAAGKGVLICAAYEEAAAGIQGMMLEGQFGSSGDTVVIEEFMAGEEVSMLCFCDGTHIQTMASARDHKRARDLDEGLNTGGMGTVSPAPFYTDAVDAYCREHIYQPVIDAMKQEGRPFTGVLFCGLMLTKDGPKVVEFNARFGDPETQVVLPRMQNDILEVFEACIDGRLEEIKLEFCEEAAVCVILASDGYPEKYEKGFPIYGLERVKDMSGCYIFHSATKRTADGIVTNGGRVLGAAALGADGIKAREKAYAASACITYQNKYQRMDIGRVLEGLQG